MLWLNSSLEAPLKLTRSLLASSLAAPALLLGAAGVVSASPVAAHPRPLAGSTSSGSSAAGNKLVNRYRANLVTIEVKKEFTNRIVEGTGVILDKHGHVLTTNDLIRGATRISVFGNGASGASGASGTAYHASVVGYDISDDVAVVKVQNAKNLHPASLPSGNASKGSAATTSAATLIEAIGESVGGAGTGGAAGAGTAGGRSTAGTAAGNCGARARAAGGGSATRAGGASGCGGVAAVGGRITASNTSETIETPNAGLEKVSGLISTSAAVPAAATGGLIVDQKSGDVVGLLLAERPQFVGNFTAATGPSGSSGASGSSGCFFCTGGSGTSGTSGTSGSSSVQQAAVYGIPIETALSIASTIEKAPSGKASNTAVSGSSGASGSSATSGASGGSGSGKEVHTGPTAFLGTRVLPSHTSGQGLTVALVYKGSPAFKAGLRAGDHLVSFDGKKLSSVDGFEEMLVQENPKTAVKLSWKTPKGGSGSGSATLARGPAL
jgi:S1-C subfamily serine protease